MEREVEMVAVESHPDLGGLRAGRTLHRRDLHEVGDVGRGLPRRVVQPAVDGGRIEGPRHRRRRPPDRRGREPAPAAPPRRSGGGGHRATPAARPGQDQGAGHPVPGTRGSVPGEGVRIRAGRGPAAGRKRPRRRFGRRSRSERGRAGGRRRCRRPFGSGRRDECPGRPRRRGRRRCRGWPRRRGQPRRSDRRRRTGREPVGDGGGDPVLCLEQVLPRAVHPRIERDGAGRHVDHPGGDAQAVADPLQRAVDEPAHAPVAPGGQRARGRRAGVCRRAAGSGQAARPPAHDRHPHPLHVGRHRLGNPRPDPVVGRLPADVGERDDGGDGRLRQPRGRGDEESQQARGGGDRPGAQAGGDTRSHAVDRPAGGNAGFGDRAGIKPVSLHYSRRSRFDRQRA